MQRRTKPSRPAERSESSKLARSKQPQREGRHPVRTVLKWASLGVGGLVIVLVGAGAGYATAMLKGLPKISASTFSNLSQASVVYDIHGKVIGRYTSSGDRQPIASVDQVSPYLANAFIAAEDKTFRTNIGINPLAMARAFVEDVTSHHIQSGASTITQQTVKLAVFPAQQRDLKRKIQEIALALKLNHILTKNEILTDYMNWVYMGDMGGTPVYGVQSASQILFHTSPKNLNIAEASLMAGMVNNAYLFSPYVFPQNAIARQHYVLQQMLKNHFITPAQYQAAINYPVIKHIFPAQASANTNYPLLMVDEITPRVVQDLVKAGLYSNTQQAFDALPTAGYQIHTSLDLSVQNHVDSVLAQDQLFGNTNQLIPGTKNKYDLYNAGVTIINNQTGGIMAIGIGRDSPKDIQLDQIDHANIARQPGSSVKPLIDYGPAFDLHRETAGTWLPDIPVQYPGGPGQKPYAPKDDTLTWQGLVSVRTALVQSINVPAVETLDKITPEVGTSYFAREGIPVGATTISGQPTLVKADTEQLATAIGGMTHGLTVEQMTSAYTTFPNQGTWRQSYVISSIDDRTGNRVYQVHQQVNQVFSPQTAWVMTNILHDVIYRSDGTAATTSGSDISTTFPGQFISGKTGTTDTQGDGWFIGYTQKYTAGIWMGYNNHERIPTAYYPLKFTLWSDIMKPLLTKNPANKPWPKPPGIVTAAVCADSGQMPSTLCKQDGAVYNEYFIQGTEPSTLDSAHVLVDYTVYQGKRYLATTATPASQVRTGIFINPPFKLPLSAPTTMDSQFVPTQPDPRGGTVLLAPTGGQLPSAINPPSNVNAVLATDGSSVAVTWNRVPGATGYLVSRSTSPSGPFVTIGGPMTQTTFTDSSLPPNSTDLYYQVYATSSQGMSDPSAEITVHVAAPTTGGSGSGGQPGNTVGTPPVGNPTGSGAGKKTGNSIG